MFSMLILDVGEIQLHADKKYNCLFNVEFYFQKCWGKITVSKNKGQ